MTASNKIQLKKDRWFAWQMLPGYSDVPYFSPIYIRALEPLRTGRSLLRVSFFNVGYAHGVQDFETTLRIVRHARDHLVAGLEDSPDRTVIITELTWAWLERFCDTRPEACSGEGSDERIQNYLTGLFA